MAIGMYYKEWMKVIRLFINSVHGLQSRTHPAQVERLAENVQVVSRQVPEDDVPTVHDDVQTDIVHAFLEHYVHHHGYTLQHDVGVEVLGTGVEVGEEDYSASLGSQFGQDHQSPGNKTRPFIM